MANPLSLQKQNGRHLWFAFLGLGFQPDTATSSIAKLICHAKHINLVPLLVKSMRDEREESAKYGDLLKRYSSDSAQEAASLAEKTKNPLPDDLP